MTDLHDLILPTLDPCSRQDAQQLFQDIFSSSSKVISFLQLGDISKKPANLIKYRRKGGKNNVESHMLGDEAKEIGNKRRYVAKGAYICLVIYHLLGLNIFIPTLRKNAQHTGSVMTQAPHFDGYQWRKYGQKWISKAKHSRYVNICVDVLLIYNIFYTEFRFSCVWMISFVHIYCSSNCSHTYSHLCG
jgi:hypothetical protein